MTSKAPPHRENVHPHRNRRPLARNLPSSRRSEPMLLLLPFVISFELGNIQANDTWKAGIAVVKITPEAPLQMSGYASRIKPYEGINDDIYAKALALQDSQGHKAVIITTDLIGFTAPISDPIAKRISDRTG